MYNLLQKYLNNPKYVKGPFATDDVIIKETREAKRFKSENIIHPSFKNNQTDNIDTKLYKSCLTAHTSTYKDELIPDFISLSYFNSFETNILRFSGGKLNETGKNIVHLIADKLNEIGKNAWNLAKNNLRESGKKALYLAENKLNDTDKNTLHLALDKLDDNEKQTLYHAIGNSIKIVKDNDEEIQNLYILSGTTFKKR